MNIAEDAGLGRLGVAPRQHLERCRIGDGEDIGFLHAREAVDGGTVEGHTVLEGVLELCRADGKGLEDAKYVGEPETDESYPALFHGVEHVVALLFVHGNLSG
ncbi:unannotated protein [freshwater metagenome]|uniref:Unannotated protein n=1 Tax=freshwater metagenome TaxID=449393 RepID=A0A6J6VYE8_9ZZZZ